ncbi:MAG: hypothetical protein PW786_05105 [Arachidicoccus sp.]|nr:hypothetical protein [Arachidicoccus sp.]
MWLTKEDFHKIADANAPVSLIDYLVYDEKAPLGKVEEVIEQPHQILLKIFFQNKEVLIPLHEETLNSIDRKNKKIYLTLPDGLLDIYLK